ncbi:MAG: peptide chain release factor N(5)-glutamine methyltransferase [Acetobacteraceae bacterium]|nr:peptide chain release factor N(5)-glutamine methyltransferase [Acetobacteraceae bacterium]
MTAREALRHGGAQLAAAGVDNPRLDARLLLAYGEDISQAALLADPGRPVNAARYDALLARRAAREPLAYIVGSQEFWSLPFQVSPATLIPRADSEAVVEAALTALAPDSPGPILDLGTGTGCLLLAVLHERRRAWGVGVDLAPDAAQLAARNARALGLADRVAFLAGDWDSAVAGRFAVILSNPPYVTLDELAGLQPEVGVWEPRRALDGGADGLAAYRRILARIPLLLAPSGSAVLEVGAGQADPVAALAAQAGLRLAGRQADLSGTIRALRLNFA